MRVKLEFGGDIVFNGAFHHIDIAARRNACAVSKPKNMGINRLGGLLPPHVQNDIGGFAPHTRKGLKGGTTGRNDPIILLDQNSAHLDDILGFVAKQPDGLDMLDQTLFAQIKHFLRRIGDFEQFCRGLIHARICRLRREGHSHDQRIDIHMVQFAFWFRLGGLKAREDLVDRMVIKLFGHGAPFDLPCQIGQA